MPEAAKGPRLWLRRKRRDKSGAVTHPAIWYIRDDGRYQQSTGCSIDDRKRAVEKLADYIAQKRIAATPRGARDPAAIPIADVIARYVREITAKRSRPKEGAQRARALLAYFGDKTLAEVNGDVCRAYAEQRSTDAAARRELEDLRAAINHHRREGLCSQVIEVVLPPERPARERWLTRSEAAHLIRAAWRYREMQKGKPTDRRSRRHIAKFILVALYTGTRASAICGAALQATVGRPWIDLDPGVFYRRAPGRLETKKRQPPVPLPPGLLAHLRRWKGQGQGQRFAVEWNREPVRSIKRAFGHVVADAGLGEDVTPHVLRHTAATWLMQAGVDIWEAAGFVGMTVEMLSQRYGHHHPAHLQRAKNAFGQHRHTRRHTLATTEREQSSSNVTNFTVNSRTGS
jgi:integrase